MAFSAKRLLDGLKDAVRFAMTEPLPFTVIDDAEAERQRAVLTARDYYEGKHDVPLTERQRAYLGFVQGQEFSANFCRVVVTAVVERLLVSGFDCDEEAVADWLWNAWELARMPALQRRIYERAVSEGEAFVIVDWDTEKGRPRLIAHPRYTDPSLGGTGFGCWAVYPDNDPDQEMLYACKRWTETYRDDKGRSQERRRLTVYYPDRVEKYALQTNGDWSRYSDEEDAGLWPLPWLDQAGKPLGIPVIHFRNPGLRAEHKDAIPLQMAANKTLLAALASADTGGFRILVARGFHPTTDNRQAKDDGSNLLRIAPGMWIGNVPKDGAVDAIDPEDPTGILAVFDAVALTIARVTDTPASRFQLSRAIAAEGTLKQMNEPLISKCRMRTVLFGDAWKDVMRLAMTLANFYTGAGLNVEASFDLTWESIEPRDEKEELEALGVKRTQLLVPVEKLWAEAGYTQEEIDKMKQSPDYQARLAQLTLAIMGGDAMAQQGYAPGGQQVRSKGQAQGGRPVTSEKGGEKK